MAEIKINDIALSLDLDDVEAAERIQQAITDSAAKIAEIDGKDYVSDIRAVCETVNECFNGIFGNGTADKLFVGMKFTQHIDAFAVLCDAIRDQMSAQRQHAQEVYSKYSPNRTSRRVQSKSASAVK